jgi:hypothetical protein
MVKHTHIRGINAAGVALSKRIEVEGGSQIEVNEPITSGANRQVAFAIDVSQLKSLFILAAAALVIKTNSSGSPANTIALIANQPFSWHPGDGTLRDTNGTAITTDITTIYVTNPEDTDVDLRLFALVDPTV